MKVKINFPDSEAKTALLNLQLKNINLTPEGAETRLVLASKKAEEMVRLGYDEIEKLYQLEKEVWVDTFNSNELLERWFGKVKKKGDVEKVRNRIKGIFKRLFSGYTIAIKPENDKSPLAITMGAANVTNTRFRVYPSLIKMEIWDVARTIIHEIGHHWFTDQKLGDVTVYGENVALDLATYDPKKARRSTENYSFYFAKVHESKGKRTKGKGYFKASI